MIACIDGGLICGPVIIWILSTLGVGAGVFKFFKWCKKSCTCDCHTAPSVGKKILKQWRRKA
jgi:hypothetical protein